MLSDRIGARPFATGGMIGTGTMFILLSLLPVNFTYAPFAVLLFLEGLSMGAFASPNRAAVMNSLPRAERGAGSGMTSTFQLSAQVLSIGIFFSLMIAGLSSKLPSTMAAGLQAHGVDATQAQRIAHLPPVSILFAAFLGYNPIKTLLGPKVLATLSTANANTLTGRSFFPHLIADPFRTGLHEAFAFSVAACALAALMSWSRGGGRYVSSDTADAEEEEYTAADGFVAH
jgi:MFS family permease